MKMRETHFVWRLLRGWLCNVSGTLQVARLCVSPACVVPGFFVEHVLNIRMTTSAPGNPVC